MVLLSRKWKITLLCALTVVLCGAFYGARVKAQDSSQVPALTDEQCVLCHSQQPATIATEGGLHESAVGCQDCHVEHPPTGTGAIPECSMCHAGSAHYELEDCSSCHSDAHAPLKLVLQGDITEPCLTCHPQQGEETSQHPSVHADVACNFCHMEHRQIPSCLDCHGKHTEDMVFEDCKTCHPAHMPLNVTYPNEVPSHYCGSCHGEAYDVLAANTTMHHDLSCAFCHRNIHKNVPPCFACHGQPHPEEMLQKFPDCGQCHGTAHDLRK